MRHWFHPVPVYVTRKNANGDCGQFTIGAIFGLVIVFLMIFNLIAWGCIGLYEAARVV